MYPPQLEKAFKLEVMLVGRNTMSLDTFYVLVWAVWIGCFLGYVHL